MAKYLYEYFKIQSEKLDLASIELKHPSKKKVTSNHTLIVSSTQRDYELYPNSNNYLIDLSQPYKNVEKLELIAVMLPKTEYNINSNNNILKIKIGIGSYVFYTLTPGQYTIGSNVIGDDYIANGDPPVSGLIAELYRVLNLADPTHFKVFLCTAPTPNGTGQFASPLNRILIHNDANSFSIDFTNNNSPYEVLGFVKQVYNSGSNTIYGSAATIGKCSPIDLSNPNTYNISDSIISVHDYNLSDIPNYVIMELSIGRNNIDRNESLDKSINNFRETKSSLTHINNIAENSG
jgi:hypothetical protein